MARGYGVPTRLLVAVVLVLAPGVLGLRVEKVHSPKQHGTASRRELRVAFAVVVPYGVLQSSEWRDGLAVMAHSAQKVAARSAHNTTLLAILPETVPSPDEERRVLAKLGLEALFVPIPVPLEEVKSDFARQELAKVLGQNEQLKYYGAALTQYDRVVILDGDTMWRAPIDELFSDAHGAKLQGTYDHELDIPKSAFPPLNSGFLVYVPDERDFRAISDIYREGDFRDGTGWMGSRTGWTYGTGSQGILSFYYNQVQPGVPGYSPAEPKKAKDLPGLGFTEQPPSSRFRPLDRSVYNVVDSSLVSQTFNAGLADASRVKIFHFTGDCPKPWLCEAAGTELCERMTQEWWSLRAELAERWGGSARRCRPFRERYKVLPLAEEK